MIDSMKHRRLLKAKLAIIEKELLKVLQVPSEARLLYDASLHPIISGGKRLRPLLTLMTCEAVGGDFLKALPVATAVELIHTASLIHDDLIDNDLERRAAPTVHTKYDRDVAVLSGDLLIAKAMQIISENPSVKIRRTMAEACIEMSEGEYLDTVFKKHPETVTEENYLTMVRKKTGALVRAAAGSGALIGGGDSKEVELLSKYGEYLGLSLQLRDDVQEILAAFANKTTLSGKCLLGQGSNLVLIHSFINSGKSSPHFTDGLTRTNESCSSTEDLMEVFENSTSIQHVQGLSEQFERKATDAIAGMHFRNQRTLEDLVEFVVHVTWR